MPERNRNSRAVTLLSAILALVIWTYVTWERTAERRISVPVRCRTLAGVTATGAPAVADVVVSGPRLSVALLKPEGLIIDLDLSGAREGVSVFPAPEQHLRLPEGLNVVRMHPGRIEVRLARPVQ